MSDFEEVETLLEIKRLLHENHRLLIELKKQGEKIMAQIDDLDAAQAKTGADVATLAGLVNQLIAKIQPQDLTKEITAEQATDTVVGQAIAAANAALGQ